MIPPAEVVFVGPDINFSVKSTVAYPNGSGRLVTLQYILANLSDTSSNQEYRNAKLA